MAAILSKWPVLSIGVVFHLAFLMSIFDIYFLSPLVHGMRHHSAENPDPAKRLFLVVGDGLRADKFYVPQVHPASGAVETLAPYLVAKLRNGEALGGISHTRMPTESRPGHVALIAGFYEDVSAVTKGWQTNPVNFDSVFNQSRHTWSFGSPDILPMFAIGAEPGRVDADAYDASFEDFTMSSIELDKYSFEHLDALFEAAKHNATLNAELRKPGVVFFLHLLGIDSAGHYKRPYSAEYYDNIKYVDAGVKLLEQKVREFYDDDETAFVFTADHGMSDLGSHGDGHPDNTRTPLVVWGKGVRAASEVHDRNLNGDLFPQLSEQGVFSAEFGGVEQIDVEQADIASLMAYLAGLNYPVNSVGQLPLEYLAAGPETQSRALAANAFTISEQFLEKKRRVESAQLRFKNYPGLNGAKSVSHRRAAIHHHLESGNWAAATQAAHDLSAEALTGLRYLQQYNWLLLRTLVTLGFLGWIAFAFTSFLHLFIVKTAADPNPLVPNLFVKFLFGGVFSALTALLYSQHSPTNYYLYAFFPTLFWYIVASHRRTVSQGFRKLAASSTKLGRFGGFVAAFLLLEGIVRGYFHRELFSAILVAFMPWPLVENWRVAWKQLPTTLLWMAACLAVAGFGLLPVNKIESLPLITGSGIAMAGLSLVYLLYLVRKLTLSTVTMVTSGFQLSLIILAVIVTRWSVESLQADQGLPIGSQLMGWMTMVFSLLVPFMHSLAPVTDYRLRLANVFMLFSPTMVILTISYEGYFYVAFALLIFAWLHLETAFAEARQNKALTLSSFRLALMFLFFTHIAFFATGNIASISSFSLDSVYRLIPVFNPFSMGALLILKILVPFILLSVVLGVMNLKIGLPSYALFSMVLPVCDVLSLNFFYLVVDEGSWLDIGTGISHYCVCSLLCLFLSLIEYLSTALVSGIEIVP